jgi:N-acetylmuramic acid 6-phosphate etherase
MNSNTTESQNNRSLEIDNLSTIEIISLINDEDSHISHLIKEIIPNISSLVEKILISIKKKGRLIYVGCGTSGRLGVLDASECPPTFSTNPKQIVGIIAGGYKALHTSVEGAEDDISLAKIDFKKNNICDKDTVIGISASGTTPYVHKVLELSHKVNASTAILTSNKINNKKYIDKKIEIVVGPEIITGSTRMKAGTATKMILNMISTTTMILLNKTYKNYMVDLKVNNIKLRKRALKIIDTLTELNEKKAGQLLDKAKGKVKVALLMYINNIEYSNANKILIKNKGSLRISINKI